MKLSLASKSALALACLALAAAPAQAVDIASSTGGNQTAFGGYRPGQSFTVVGSGSYTNITFNFFSDAGTTPFASGTGFLLSTAYSGNVAGLSSGTAGYLGQATASGGLYDFGGSATLIAGTQYFFYSTGLLSSFGDITGSGSNLYSGGVLYSDGGGNTNYGVSSGDWNFRVNGTATGVPDAGSTALLLALGVAGLWFGRRARQA